MTFRIDSLPVRFAFAVLPFTLAAALAPAPTLAASNGVGKKTEPATIQVAAGNTEVLSAHAKGIVVYECRREKAPLTAYKWLMVSPQAVLRDADGKDIGSHSGIPATWSHVDGSFVTGSQVAVTPNGEGNLPFQLVKTDIAGGQGVLTTVSYIQRLGTQGGAAPKAACAEKNEGEQVEVDFTAAYRFWKAN